MSASKTGAISNCAGATSLWRVLAGMPRRHSSRSRSIMKARTRSRIGPKYWSSSSWPLGDGAPKSVRPVSSRSGRCSARRRSTRKYSCSGPMVVYTRVAVVVAEPAQHAQRLLAQRVLRAQQRDLVVERLAGDTRCTRSGCTASRRSARPGGRSGRSRPRRCSRAPRTWRACRRTGTTTRPARPGSGSCRRTRRSCWASPDRRQERVVLLRGRAGHRHEPVRVVGRAVGHRPLLHAVGDGIDDVRIERLAPAIVRRSLAKMGLARY